VIIPAEKGLPMNSMLRSSDDNAGEAVDSVKSTKVARATKPAPRVPVAEAAGKASKPFSMSYGGTSNAEYLQYRIDRGAR